MLLFFLLTQQIIGFQYAWDIGQEWRPGQNNSLAYFI